MSLILLEGSFQQEEVPTKFYCAIILDPFDDAKMADLAERKLVGLEGITSSESEAKSFFQIGRNGLLSMDGQKTVQENRLSKVLYGNPHYLSSQNFAIFNRILGDKEKIFALESLFTDVFRDVREKARQTPISFKEREFLTHLATSDEALKTLSKMYWMFSGKINSVQSFTSWFIKTLTVMFPDKNIRELFSYNVVVSSLSKKMVEMVDSLSEEREWIVKDKVLKIPQHSTLRIALGRKNTQWDNKMKEVINTYNLTSIYNIQLGVY